MITAQRLRDVLLYDAETGEFSWRANGKAAGSRHIAGYWKVCIDQRAYLAHRLAFLYVTGEWPKCQVDHIDGNRLANHFSNLRDVPRSINQQNRRNASKHTGSGLLGAYRSGGRWRSLMRVDGASVYLGCFESAAEAHEAYLTAKRALHPGCTI